VNERAADDGVGVAAWVGLPLQLLPPGWSGETARVLFDDLNRVLSAPAREHATKVIHSEG